MTQEYIGTKIVTAWPSRREACTCNNLIHEECSRCGQPAADGYGVKYADGYTSWSPKDVFEAAYLPIGHVSHQPAWRQRLAGEVVQITRNANKLAAFITETNPQGEHGTLLQLQLGAMVMYRDAVTRRLKLINEGMGLNPPATNTGE